MYDKIKLPYSYDELEPYIDAETVNIHYNKHLQTYVNNLNKALDGYNEFVKGKTLDEILYNIEDIPQEIRQDIINQGGGVSNHNLYFSILSPKPAKSPKGKFLDEINKTFGSLEELKEKLTSAAIKQFGSGYGCLVKDKENKLIVMQVSNQNSPFSDKLIPILMIDVWEHAYYLKYKNLRQNYVENIWNIIDWSKVEEYYNK